MPSIPSAVKLQTLKITAYLTAFVCLAAPAHADWVRRVTDGIMGTQITVELWADDDAKAQRAIDAVLDEMRHVDESMSTYKPTSEVSQVNAKAAEVRYRSNRRRPEPNAWKLDSRARCGKKKLRVWLWDYSTKSKAPPAGGAMSRVF